MSKLKNNWEKLHKLCQPQKQQKRSLSRECKSIPNLQSSRQIQRRASQQDLVMKVVESSIQDIEAMNAKQQLETIVNGLQGLLGYEMIMRKGKLEELLKKLKYYLYCDSAELQMFGKKLGDYIINPKLYNIVIGPQEEQSSKEILELTLYELQLQISQRKQAEWKQEMMKEVLVADFLEKNKEVIELQNEVAGLKQALNLLEQQNQTLQNKLRNEQMIQQYEELRRYSKSLSDRNDDLYYQNLSLLEKLQNVYKLVDNHQNEQLQVKHKLSQDDVMTSIKGIVEDIINLNITKPQQYIDVDFKDKMLNMTPRPNFELLISKYNTKTIKYIRQLQSTDTITQYLIQQLYQLEIKQKQL